MFFHEDLNTLVCHNTPDSLYCKALKDQSGNVSLYKIVSGECGQADVPPNYAPYAIEFAGLTKGTCSNEGYTHDDGSKTMDVPVIGEVTIALYSKASSLGETDVTLYKIAEGECGEATIDATYEKYAEEFAGLSEGNCKD